jgi:hypothetical protein
MAQRHAEGRMRSYISPFMPDLTFTAEDVAANRQGMLTRQQEQTVDNAYQWRRQGRGKTLRFFMWWIPGILIVGFVIEALQSTKPFGEFLSNQLPTIAFVVALLIFLFSLIAGLDYWLSRDIRQRRISMAEGIAQTAEREMSSRGFSYIEYQLRLKNGFGRGKYFRFANAASLAHFESGKSYRVYYVKFYPFPIVLSFETL